MDNCLKVNGAYSEHFIIFLITNCPVNACLIMWITISQLSVEGTFICTVIFIYQATVIFAVHIFLSFPSKLLHKPASIFNSFMVNKQGRTNIDQFKTRWKLAIFIGTFHVQQRYGITYGPIGLITYSSFIKVDIHVRKVEHFVCSIQSNDHNRMVEPHVEASESSFVFLIHVLRCRNRLAFETIGSN
ncbi:hypothetical protein BLOT_009198, partial [Blomia tropicalis]